MIHLMNDIGCTGETFSSWDQVYLWVEESIGSKLSGRAKLNIKRGLHFKIGSRYFSCMVSEESLADVA